MEPRKGRHRQARSTCRACLMMRRAGYKKALSGGSCRRAAFTPAAGMVTMAIVAVLAAVGRPAYVCSVRSFEQAKAVKAPMRARTEKEALWGGRYWYAATMEFPPFKCRSPGKSNLSLQTSSDGHREHIDAAQADLGDALHISDNACTPVENTPKALG